MSDLSDWSDRLEDLCLRLRLAVSDCLANSLATGDEESVARPVSTGAGDVTFGLDLPSEAVATEWLQECARERPLSLLTEDAGWRHMGPTKSSEGFASLENFAHGGPRIALDPIDGTRNLMADLRSAWTVVSFAPAGEAMPRLNEITLGIVSELPISRMNRFLTLRAELGTGCVRTERGTEDNEVIREVRLDTGSDDRPDHGYFPFFRFERHQAPRIAAIESEFHRRLAEHESADTLTCYDDQYISNGGQLVLLTGGTYRFVSDLRAWLASESGKPATTSKPYDSAGAILCAREAGAILEAADGSELDFPIDATTPVSFVGWVNAATRERLRPHFDAALR